MIERNNYGFVETKFVVIRFADAKMHQILIRMKTVTGRQVQVFVKTLESTNLSADADAVGATTNILE